MGYVYEAMTSDGMWSDKFFLQWKNCLHFPDNLVKGIDGERYLWGSLKSIDGRKLIEWEGLLKSIQKEIKNNPDDEEFQCIEIILYGERRDIIIYFINEKTIKHKMLASQHPLGEFGRDHK